MKHKIIDHIRKEIRQRNIGDKLENDPTSEYFSEDGSWQSKPSSWQTNPEALYNNDEFRKVLHQCMQHLPEKQRIVFEMRELLGDDSEQICKTNDITPTHLHVLIHRARLSLQKCLQQHWFGES